MKPVRLFVIVSLLLLIPNTRVLGLQSDTIKIGFLIANTKSPAARYGAELAVKQANRNGGFNGHPFKVVVRSMEGAWGTGSREAASLIFEENVWAIVGSHDGRNAHIVEQVSAKARRVFLSAWSGDPTLSQAFVPWFFNCVPNNRQQAEMLIDEIYNKKKFKTVAVVAEKNYDSELAMESFTRKVKLNGRTHPVQFLYESNDPDLEKITEQIIRQKADCIIMFGSPTSSIKILKLLKEKNINIPVYGALSLLDENEFSSFKDYENTVLLSPLHWLKPESEAFINEYQSLYGEIPGAVAAYSYDALNMIVEAVSTGGLDHEEIRKSLAAIKYNGVTGKIEFDDKGNRKGPFQLMKIKNGKPEIF